MNKCHCDVIKDLVPLYLDSLASDTSASLIKEHLAECSSCRDYYESLKEDMKIDIPVDKKQIEDLGITIIKRIMQVQDRIKYTFIIFAMFVAVGMTMMSISNIAIIPGIIIIPLILRLFYKESLVILLSAFGAAMIITLAGSNIGRGLLMLPLILVCTTAGLTSAKLLHSIFLNKE